MRNALAKYQAIAQATPRMTRKQRQSWKCRQMVALRLEQAREFRANADAKSRRWAVESALGWRKSRNK